MKSKGKIGLLCYPRADLISLSSDFHFSKFIHQPKADKMHPAIINTDCASPFRTPAFAARVRDETKREGVMGVISKPANSYSYAQINKPVLSN